MQFTTNVQLLLDGLNTVTRALSARPTKQILEGVHLSAVGEHVKLTCSDGNLSIEMSILADVKEEGTAVLPGRLFTELSRKLPGGEVTIRVGENFTLDHGIYTEAGDVANIEIANTNSAISLRDNVITGVNNGYATLLITSKRYPDILIVYNITVGYAPLTIASVQPSASKLNNYETLAWDITFAGGRPNYNVNFKVYRGTTVVVNSNRTETATGRISVNYQPTVAGTYLLEVTITSADGQSITQRSSATVVSNYTPVTVVPSTTASVTNRNLTWTTAYKGTSSVIRRDYTLFRDGSVVATEVGLNNLTFNYTPTVAGSYILRVIVYEANGNKIEVTAPTITVTQGGSGTSGTGTVTGVRVALRRGASTKYGIILRVDKGETVPILERSGSWYYVSYKGTKGWMMAQYVKAN